MKMKKRLLSILLSLVLMLGLFPGMSLTAYADTETLLITINSTSDFTSGSRTFNNIATVTFSSEVECEDDNDGWYNTGKSDKILSVTPAAGYTITKVKFYCKKGSAFDETSPFEATLKSGLMYVNGSSYGASGVNKIEVYGYATPTATHSVTITPGSNMTKTTDSGAASQADLSGSMTPVVYTANDGYYFPTDYSVTSVNGISVTRNSYTQITVSGTPTADAKITLTAPTAKTKPDAPTTAAAVDCTTTDNNDGKLTGVTTAMEYKKSDATDWIAGTGSDITGLVPGTYYVRLKATDTTTASDNQELTIAEYTAPTYTVTYKVVNGTWSDDTTTDKTETVQSGSTPASVPTGMKAASGYTGGAWDINPAEATITGATTFTYTFTALPSYQVTYKVVNGTWSDDSTTDKTETVQSGSKPASVPTGMIASSGYTDGAWDNNPAEATITGATTFTYTFTALPSYQVTYKVVNGTWSDYTTTDKTETVQSGSKPASVPTGMIASSGYTDGAWDNNPAEATITGATTFTYTFTALPSYQVTYKVVNGTWSDYTTTDKTETVQSGSKPASVPTGMKASEGYTGGAWDTNPADATITGAATFTYTFTKKDDSSGTPGEKQLVYNRSAQELVTAGTAAGGTMMYALGTDATTAPTEGWSEAIPTGVDAKTYYVWYMVKGDENHNDSEPACVEATIAKKGLTVTAEAKSKTQGEADPALTYTAEGLVAGDTLTGALSREAGEDPGTYAITQGTLTAGDNYEIAFTSAVLTINKKDEPAPVPSGGGSGGGGGYYGGGAVQNQRRDAYSDVIGAAATNFWGSSPERIRNIELACEKLDGIVLQPGEVFSFNEAVGGLTAEAGFAVAPVNPDDEATAEMGGGVSQVASTLYTGSLFALLETVERTNHPFAVPFIQPGTDACVTDPGNADALDLKFRNTRSEPIRISAKTRVDEARQVREIVIELRSALGSSDYMPIRFDNTWGGDQNAFLTATPYDLTRPGYRILLTHEEQQFTDALGAGIRTLTHRKILDAAGMLVRDEILNSKLPDGSYAMDTYYQG